MPSRTSRRGPYTVDGTTTSQVIKLREAGGPRGCKLAFQAITSLTGKVTASRDGGLTYYDLVSITDEGVIVAKNGIHTCENGGELIFASSGYTHIKYSRQAGSGAFYLLEMADEDYTAALALASQAAGAAAVGQSDPICMSVRILAADGAQTNTAMVTVSAGTRIGVKLLNATPDGDNSVKPNLIIGFAAASLATPNTTSGAGILMNYQGMPATGGMVKGNGAAFIGIGADGEDLRYTCEAPTGGSLNVDVTYVTLSP